MSKYSKDIAMRTARDWVSKISEGPGGISRFERFEQKFGSIQALCVHKLNERELRLLSVAMSGAYALGAEDCRRNKLDCELRKELCELQANSPRPENVIAFRMQA